MRQLTEEIINLGKSKNGGYNKKQLLAIGISWPPVKGWKKIVIKNRYTNEKIEEFLKLKGN